jgi:hypothetical protein
MGLLHKLLGRNVTNHAAETTCRPDARAEDPLLAQLRESQARRAEMSAQVDAARARIRELGRRYPYTS